MYRAADLAHFVSTLDYHHKMPSRRTLYIDIMADEAPLAVSGDDIKAPAWHWISPS